METGTCPTEIKEPGGVQELPCRVGGYFKSQDVVGGYYRCVWNGQTNKWTQYRACCPAGLEFSEQLQTCVRP
ncbi:chitin-binding domain-containing protein [Pseudomonas azotoformans]